jgi:hypothetical protein
MSALTKTPRSGQRAAIERFAKSAGFSVVDWFNDPAVSGADPIETRPAFLSSLTGSRRMAFAL